MGCACSFLSESIHASCKSWLKPVDICDGCVRDECTSGRQPGCCVSFECDATNGQCIREPHKKCFFQQTHEPHKKCFSNGHISRAWQYNLLLRSYDLGLPQPPSAYLGHKLPLVEARNTSTEPIIWAVGCHVQYSPWHCRTMEA